MKFVHRALFAVSALILFNLLICSPLPLHCWRNTQPRVRNQPRRLLGPFASISANLNKLREAIQDPNKAVGTSLIKAPPSSSNPNQNKLRIEHLQPKVHSDSLSHAIVTQEFLPKLLSTSPVFLLFSLFINILSATTDSFSLFHTYNDPTSRSTRFSSRNGLYFDDRFLVQETSRQMGWSCYHLKNCRDEKRGESYCMQEKSNQALGGQHEAHATEADEGNKPCLSMEDNRDGNDCSSAVQFDIVQPFASSELGREVSYKKKKQTSLLETEMGRDKKMELGNSSEKNIEDENVSKRTRTLFCPTNCEYFVPPENVGFAGPGMQGGMCLEYRVAETKEKPSKGEKWNEGDQSGDAMWYIETFRGNHASKEGRLSSRGKRTGNGKNGSGGRRSMRGTPRKMISRSSFTL